MCLRGACGRDGPRVPGCTGVYRDVPGCPAEGFGRKAGAPLRRAVACSRTFPHLLCHEPGSRVSSGNSRTHSISSIHPLPRQRMICGRSGLDGCDVGRDDREAGRTRCRATRGAGRRPARHGKVTGGAPCGDTCGETPADVPAETQGNGLSGAADKVPAETSGETPAQMSGEPLRGDARRGICGCEDSRNGDTVRAGEGTAWTCLVVPIS